MYFFFWCKCSEHDTACSMGTCTYSLQVFINGSSNIRSLLHKFCVTLSCLTVLRRGFATSGVLKAVDSKLKVTGSNPSLVSKCLHPYLLSLRMVNCVWSFGWGEKQFFCATGVCILETPLQGKYVTVTNYCKNDINKHVVFPAWSQTALYKWTLTWTLTADLAWGLGPEFGSIKI